MKTLIPALVLTLLASCGHVKKEKSPKEEYSSTMTFSEEGKTYNATINLPKDMKDKVPLVVVVHEWWGRTPYIQERAAMITKEGYATLPVDLFGNGTVVETPAEAGALAGPFYQNPQMGVDRLNKFIALAKNDPHVDASKIYVIGYCFGGTQALNLARSGADIAGVVSFHGGLESTLKSTGIKARVLTINGLADPMVPAKQRTGFDKEMKALKADYKQINYKGAKHAFTNPKATEVGK
ncbi:MAG: dienelactone hydrolase family protein, partial [Bdellovibrionota bacterium]